MAARSEPVEQDFVRMLLAMDPASRLTADGASQHPWLLVPRPSLSSRNLSAGLESLRQSFNGRRKLRGAMKLVRKRFHGEADM